MELTEGQKKGLKIAIDRYNTHKAYTCISGYAGVGKSTLAKFIVSALHIAPENVCYVAFTGKAALVLQEKGCPNAKTAHKLLYKSYPRPDGTYVYTPLEELEGDYQLIIVDEVSMLPKTMWELLLTHGIHVIALGDPFQLPPINKNEDNHVLDDPHVFLTEVMRQAQESEIIRLSMHVREGKPITQFKGDNSQVKIVKESELVTGMFTWADQIICATNAKRNQLNFTTREILGFDPNQPLNQDKVISLCNHWNIMSTDNVYALTNGGIGQLSNIHKTEDMTPAYIYGIKVDSIPVLEGDLTTDFGATFTKIKIDYNSIVKGTKTLQPKEEYWYKRQVRKDPPYEFAYGYAITCWKAQGSEWNKVLFFEEKFPFDKIEHQRYLYTGITRAAEKIVIVVKD